MFSGYKKTRHNLSIASATVPVCAVLFALSFTMPGLFKTIEAVSETDKSCLILTELIQYQSTDIKTGGQVSMLQQFLIDQKVLALIKPDGFFGLSSVSALKKYQAKSRISDIGYLDSRTKNKIQVDTCSAAELTKINKNTADLLRVKFGSASLGAIAKKQEGGGVFTVSAPIVNTRNRDGKIIDTRLLSETTIIKSAPKGKTGSSSEPVLKYRVSTGDSAKALSVPYTISSPKGGEIIKPNTEYTIYWNAGKVNTRDGVRIALVNTNANEVTRFLSSSLVGTSTFDLANITSATRAIASSTSGLPELVQNLGKYTWKVSTDLIAGTGYRIYIGNSETGLGRLSAQNFSITKYMPAISKVRSVRTTGGYLVNLTGENLAPGLSVRFVKNGKVALDVDSEWVQVFGKKEIQFFLRDEDMSNIRLGTLITMSVFKGEHESNKKDIIFWK